MIKQFVIGLLLIVSCVANAKMLTAQEAVTLAESFIVKNGYTDASPDEVSVFPQLELLDAFIYQYFLKSERFNTLKNKAIGVRKGRNDNSVGWSVAFDFVDTDDYKNCRVVTMSISGSDIKIEHVDGIRKYFVGFSQ